MNAYKVILQYFKESGKYYAQGEYETTKEFMFQIIEQVNYFAQRGLLPGIIGSNEFHIYINCPDHPNGYPHLLMRGDINA